MYELEQGVARLANVLYNRIYDDALIQRLAADLNYLPDQLKEDIQALSDHVDRVREEEAEEEEYEAKTVKPAAKKQAYVSPDFDIVSFDSDSEDSDRCNFE